MRRSESVAVGGGVYKRTAVKSEVAAVKSGYKKKTVGGGVDVYIVIAVLALVSVGLLMVLTSSYYMAQSSKEYAYDGLGLFKKQLVGVVVGLVIMLVVSRFDYRKLIKMRYGLLLFALIMLALVFTPFGVEMNGATRWVRIAGSPSIQPSEIAKVCLIIFTAATIYVNRNRMDKFRYGIMASCVALVPICLMLYFQPNFSSIILMCLIVFIMMYVGGAKGWQLAALGGGGVLAGYGMMMLESYREGRINNFLDPWQNATGGGYQIIQSLYGIGSGGILGRGLGNGRQKYLWLPYGESDYIFAILAEELGLVGAICVIAIFVFLIYRGVRVAMSAPDLFGTMLVTGIIALIGIQMILNIGVATATIPATGVPLPFVSYGNWSLMINLAMMGVVLNVSRQSKRAEAKEGAEIEAGA